MAGVPRCIFGTFDGYKKALEIANSDHIGVCLCVGCWLEGGKAVGCTPEEFIKYLLERKKLFKLHVRNVTAPLDAEGGFNETFPTPLLQPDRRDQAHCTTGLRRRAILNDHLIDMVGGILPCEAFLIYLKAWWTPSRTTNCICMTPAGLLLPPVRIKNLPRRAHRAGKTRRKKERDMVGKEV
jgi:hypothetical protein